MSGFFGLGPLSFGFRLLGLSARALGLDQLLGPLLTRLVEATAGIRQAAGVAIDARDGIEIGLGAVEFAGGDGCPPPRQMAFEDLDDALAGRPILRIEFEHLAVAVGGIVVVRGTQATGRKRPRSRLEQLLDVLVARLFGRESLLGRLFRGRQPCARGGQSGSLRIDFGNGGEIFPGTIEPFFVQGGCAAGQQGSGKSFEPLLCRGVVRIQRQYRAKVFERVVRGRRDQSPVVDGNTGVGQQFFDSGDAGALGRLAFFPPAGGFGDAPACHGQRRRIGVDPAGGFELAARAIEILAVAGLQREFDVGLHDAIDAGLRHRIVAVDLEHGTEAVEGIVRRRRTQPAGVECRRRAAERLRDALLARTFRCRLLGVAQSPGDLADPGRLVVDCPRSVDTIPGGGEVTVRDGRVRGLEMPCDDGLDAFVRGGIAGIEFEHRPETVERVVARRWAQAVCTDCGLARGKQFADAGLARLVGGEFLLLRLLGGDEPCACRVEPGHRIVDRGGSLQSLVRLRELAGRGRGRRARQQFTADACEALTRIGVVGLEFEHLGQGICRIVGCRRRQATGIQRAPGLRQQSGDAGVAGALGGQPLVGDQFGGFELLARTDHFTRFGIDRLGHLQVPARLGKLVLLERMQGKRQMPHHDPPQTGTGLLVARVEFQHVAKVAECVVPGRQAQPARGQGFVGAGEQNLDALLGCRFGRRRWWLDRTWRGRRRIDGLVAVDLRDGRSLGGRCLDDAAVEPEVDAGADGGGDRQRRRDGSGSERPLRRRWQDLGRARACRGARRVGRWRLGPDAGRRWRTGCGRGRRTRIALERRQPLLPFVDALWPFLGLDGQGLVDRSQELLREATFAGLDRGQQGVRMTGDGGGGACNRIHRAAAGYRHVERRAQRIEIGPRPLAASAGLTRTVLLEGRIARRHQHRQGLSEAADREPCRTEVEQNRGTVFPEEDVVRLDVTVDEAGVVNQLQAVEQWIQGAQDGRFVNHGARLEPVSQALAADELHHHVGAAVGLEYAEYLDDAGMPKLGQSLRFGQKARQSP